MNQVRSFANRKLSSSIFLKFMVLLCWSVGWGCQEQPSTTQTKVAVTIWPLADLVEQISGKNFAVQCILPTYASPHTFQPSPREISRCHEVELYFKVGLGLDDWVDRFANQASRRSLHIIDLSQGCPTQPPAGVIEDACEAGHDDHEHGGQGDPHLWLDTRVVTRHWIPRITDHLSKLLPQQQTHFQQNATRLLQDIDNTDKEIRALLKLPAHRKVIAVHSALTYFASQYDISIVACLELWPGKTPTAQYLTRVMKAVQEHHVQVVLVEPQLSKTAAQMLARELNLRIVEIDPLGSLLQPGQHYQDMLRYNARQILQALLEK